MTPEQETIGGYRQGHPWYYLLGGKPPSLKAIKYEAEHDERGGYLAEDIAALDASSEPKRSEKLRALRVQVLAGLDRDVRIYRQCVRELRLYQQKHEGEELPNCSAEIHTSMGLKYSHLSNGFGNLHLIDQCLGRQKDLFGF